MDFWENPKPCVLCERPPFIFTFPEVPQKANAYRNTSQACRFPGGLQSAHLHGRGGHQAGERSELGPVAPGRSSGGVVDGRSGTGCVPACTCNPPPHTHPSDLLTFSPPQGRGGGRAPGEDAGAEQRQDGQERGEMCPSMIVTTETQPTNVAHKRIVLLLLLLYDIYWNLIRLLFSAAFMFIPTQTVPLISLVFHSRFPVLP